MEARTPSLQSESINSTMTHEEMEERSAFLHLSRVSSSTWWDETIVQTFLSDKNNIVF